MFTFLSLPLSFNRQYGYIYGLVYALGLMLAVEKWRVSARPSPHNIRPKGYNAQYDYFLLE
jgi:hypothetical protein